LLLTLTIPVSGQQDGAVYAMLAAALLAPATWVREKTEGAGGLSAGFVELVLLEKLLGFQTSERFQL